MNVDQFFASFAQRASYLFNRWQDEKKYEDFEDYKTNARACIEEAGGKFVSMTHRPFAITFEMKGKRYKIKANARHVEMVEMIRVKSNSYE